MRKSLYATPSRSRHALKLVFHGGEVGFGAQNVRLCWENCWIFVLSPPRPAISFSLGLNELRAWQAKVEGKALGSWSAPATAWADHQWVGRPPLNSLPEHECVTRAAEMFGLADLLHTFCL
jgi:hypothetical protein